MKSVAILADELKDIISESRLMGRRGGGGGGNSNGMEVRVGVLSVEILVKAV